VRLNYDLSDREASFRAELLHLGENAESVALLQMEGRLRLRLRRRLDALIANMRRIITVHRNLGFFTTGYGYGIQLLTLARVVLARPAFAVLHNPGTTLAPEQLTRAMARLSEANITYLTFGTEGPPGVYDAVLEL